MAKNLLPKTSALKKVDAQWFTAIKPYITELFLVLGPLQANLERYRQQFQDQAFNPDLRPRHIDANQVKQTNRQLAELKTTIGQQETNRFVSDVYSLKIDELRLQNQLLISSIEGDQIALMEANRNLYGKPKPELFAAICTWVRQQASQSISDQASPLRTAAEDILKTVPPIAGNTRLLVPPDATFHLVREMHTQPNGLFAELFGDDIMRNIPDYVSPDVGDQLTRQAIRAIGSVYALVDSSDELWGVVHEEQKVVRPVNYRLSREEFMGIVAHEIGSHLQEKVNGAYQPLQLLSVGLDKYEQSNEGRAFLREQIVYHSPYDTLRQPSWEYIILLYLAASLGYGLHQKAYNFQRLYYTLYTVCLFFQTSRRPDTPAIAELTAHNEAWHLAVRVMKGTDGRGGAYLKALVYLDGNLQAWSIARNQPEMILWGDIGKYDIGRRDHRTILQGLDILPDNL